MVASSKPENTRNAARFESVKPSQAYLAYAELVSRALLQIESGVEPIHVPKRAVERLAAAIQSAK